MTQNVSSRNGEASSRKFPDQGSKSQRSITCCHGRARSLMSFRISDQCLAFLAVKTKELPRQKMFGSKFSTNIIQCCGDRVQACGLIWVFVICCGNQIYSGASLSNGALLSGCAKCLEMTLELPGGGIHLGRLVFMCRGGFGRLTT